MIEVKHLKTLGALQRSGNLSRAAELLCITQSALSHQVKELEHKLGKRLFHRKTSPVLFTEEGQLLLQLASDTLPLFDNVEEKLKARSEEQQVVTLGIECHACFQWLVPVIQQFNQSTPSVQLELLSDNLFDGRQDLLNDKVTLLFGDSVLHDEGLTSHDIGQFELLLVSARSTLSEGYAVPEDFLDQRVLTYPLDMDKLDVFKHFLQPAKVRPRSIKQVENSHVILQMVASGMGVAVMPDWVVKRFADQALLNTRRLGETGIFKRLYLTHKAGVAPLAEALLGDIKKQFHAL